MTTIGAARFKEHCLELLDTLQPEGIIVTKHGRPVARVIPFQVESRDLIGSLRDEIKVHGDVFSTGIRWDAES